MWYNNLRVPVFSKQHTNQAHSLSIRFLQGYMLIPCNFEEVSFVQVTLSSSQEMEFPLEG